MLLHVVACCAKFETGQTFEPTTPNISFVSWSPTYSATTFSQLFQHCWGHARALHMVSKVLWIVSFPRCTAGPNIVSLVWIGNRLLILKEGQHLTRAWLTPKRTISWIPNKEAHNPTSRSKIFGESRFPGSCKISYPDKKSCIFPNPAQCFGQFPDSGNTVQTLFGCWWLISVSAHKWQVLWCFCFTVHCPSRLLFGAMLFKTFF